MTFDALFSVSSILAMAGWLFLLASPLFPQWSDRIAGLIIPAALSIGYVVMLLFFSSDSEGGYGSLSEVVALFSRPQGVLTGWIHFLAFDLIVGAWICRTARSEAIAFWLIVPVLVLTFLFGPAGFLAFIVLRGVTRLVRKQKPVLAQP